MTVDDGSWMRRKSTGKQQFVGWEKWQKEPYFDFGIRKSKLKAWCREAESQPVTAKLSMKGVVVRLMKIRHHLMKYLSVQGYAHSKY